MGIRKNGLNIMTCNKIFWCVVVPTLLFGCEVLTDNDRDNILAFQRYACRRIQRFPQRSPNSSSFYGLGWIKLTTFIAAKKVLFILTLIKNVTSVLNAVFSCKLNDFVNGRRECQLSVHRSPMFDILNECARFNLLKVVCDMMNGTLPVMSKQRWSRLVWQRAWMIEDSYWASANLIFRENDLLVATMSKANYMTWWQLSDEQTDYIRPCEVMARLVCHASKLKNDDCRLKGLAPSLRKCPNCDLYVTEDIRHILMQCPNNNDEMILLYGEIADRCPNVSRVLNDEPDECLMILMGKPIPSVGKDELTCMRSITALAVSKLYRKIMSNRAGIG